MAIQTGAHGSERPSVVPSVSAGERDEKRPHHFVEPPSFYAVVLNEEGSAAHGSAGGGSEWKSFVSGSFNPRLLLKRSRL